MNKERKRKYMYGKFYHDTYEFHRTLYDLFEQFFQEHKLEIAEHNAVVELRNQIVALLDSWIGMKKLETKFGIKIPLNATPPSVESFLEKQTRSRNRIYRPCEVCGEKRITHCCHIIPHSDGGPNAEENYLYLCPIHHHLFDHNRFSKEEWTKIDFSKKLPASQEYIKKVRLPILENFWKEGN